MKQVYFAQLLSGIEKGLSTEGLFLPSVPDFPVPAPGLPWLREGQQELAARPRPGDVGPLFYVFSSGVLYPKKRLQRTAFAVLKDRSGSGLQCLRIQD